MLAQFFVGVFTEDLKYIDDWRTVVVKTFTSISGFWFDSFTSIPWSFLDLQLYMVPKAFLLCSFLPCMGTDNLLGQDCITNGTTESANSDSRVIRIVKVLRILRIARVLNLVKFVV